MKKRLKNKILIIISILVLLCPILVLAYDKVIPGGETIGIEVHSKGVLVVGFYKVDNKKIGSSAGFKIGDIITHVNDNSVSTINEMMDIINNSNKKEASFIIKRNNKTKKINMNLVIENNILKTGLYVKDQINGLGTLSFILENKKFAGLGHEILENTTKEKFEIEVGEIYDASVNDIIKSYDGEAGEKNATYEKDEVRGIITENDETGIYGEYNGSIENRDFVDIGKIEDIELGHAIIRTVIKDSLIEEFDIEIISIDKNDKTKNILFEIVDERLLEETGGVVQGMSGSPIMQNNKMIGVVNYVIVNDTSKGYGIFIETMLEEIE